MRDIKSFIPLGKDNAISCRKLAEKMGCSERDVQAAVLQARADGYPICSTPGDGYYIPETVNEALAYYYAQRKRLHSGNVALNPVKEYIRHEASREQWHQLEQIERELSDTTKTALGATNTESGNRD